MLAKFVLYGLDSLGRWYILSEAKVAPDNQPRHALQLAEAFGSRVLFVEAVPSPADLDTDG